LNGVSAALIPIAISKWHVKSQLCVDEQLANWGHSLLLDRHSYSGGPFDSEPRNFYFAKDVIAKSEGLITASLSGL